MFKVMIGELNLGDRFYFHEIAYTVDAFIYDNVPQVCGVVCVRLSGSHVRTFKPCDYVDADQPC